MELPPEIKYQIARRKNPQFSSEVCLGCTGKCCSGPGFALLENVVEIYDRYITSNLTRSDYQYKPNLSFCQFVMEYFDRVVFNNSLLVFFQKLSRPTICYFMFHHWAIMKPGSTSTIVPKISDAFSLIVNEM